MQNMNGIKRELKKVIIQRNNRNNRKTSWYIIHECIKKQEKPDLTETSNLIKRLINRVALYEEMKFRNTIREQAKIMKRRIFLRLLNE